MGSKVVKQVPMAPKTMRQARRVVMAMTKKPDLMFAVATLLSHGHGYRMAGPWTHLPQENRWIRCSPVGEVVAWVQVDGTSTTGGWVWDAPDDVGEAPSQADAMEMVDAELDDTGWVVLP